MPMTPPRKNLAIAIDGGGAKGLIVAQALITLEQALGGKPLIEYPNLKILTGTSTGTIISAGIALGMSARAIVQMYTEATGHVFPPLFPSWLPQGLQAWLTLVVGLTRPSLYSPDAIKPLIRKPMEKQTGNPNWTLRDLRKRLRPDQALFMTAVDINQRRTRFLKSYQENDGDWKLWEAILASSSAPTILPVFKRGDIFFTDGGAGAYGNPAYIAAREAVDWSHFSPNEVSVFSFGTGWLSPAGFQKANGPADKWNILNWALNASNIMIGDAARAQSLEIIDAYMPQANAENGMDFRRFQVELAQDFAPFAPMVQTNQQMLQLGDELGQRILNNRHALGAEPGFDPEGLRDILERYTISRQMGMQA